MLYMAVTLMFSTHRNSDKCDKCTEKVNNNVMSVASTQFCVIGKSEDMSTRNASITNNLYTDLSMAAGRGLCSTIYYGSQKKACETGYIAGYSGLAEDPLVKCNTFYNRDYEQHACHQGTKFGLMMNGFIVDTIKSHDTSRTQAG